MLVFDKWDELDPDRITKKIVGAINSNAGTLLGALLGARLDLLGDQLIPIAAPQYLGGAPQFLVTDILIANASAPPDDNQAGNIFSAPDAGGFAILNPSLPSPGWQIGAISTLGWLTTPAACLSIARDFEVPGKILSSASLFLNLYEASGSPVTVDIYVFGHSWPPVSQF